MNKYDGILTQLKDATGPDDEIDKDIVRLFGEQCDDDPESGPYWIMEFYGDSHMLWHDGVSDIPAFSGSIDAALALVSEKLPGWDWVARPGFAQLYETPGDVWSASAQATAPTVPIAILIALFKALEAQEE